MIITDKLYQIEIENRNILSATNICACSKIVGANVYGAIVFRSITGALNLLLWLLVEPTVACSILKLSVHIDEDWRRTCTEKH